VRKGEEVPHFVSCLLDEPIEEFLVIGRETIMGIGQARGRDDGVSCLWTGKAEEILVPLPVEIFGDDKEDEVTDTRSPLVKIERIEEGSGICLIPSWTESGHQEGIFAELGGNRQEVLEFLAERSLDTGGRTRIPKNKEFHSLLFMAMEGFKHIERLIASYIAENYTRAAEIGVGRNSTGARILQERCVSVFCTDIAPHSPDPLVKFVRDDIFSPDIELYMDCDLVYSIRPHEEMVPPLIRLAQTVDCDLLVYHLGFENFGNGGELIDCGVVLHRYHRRQNPSKRVF
jgi:uncharacterized UPF0146 family protein